MTTSASSTRNLTDFACHLYKTLVGNFEGSNLVLSPLSISVALGMTLAGSRGKSLEQLLNIVGLQDENHAHKAFKSILESMRQCESDKTSLYMANFVYPDKSFSVLPEFLDLLKDFYDTTTETLNYEDKVESSRYISNKISEVTRGKIENMITPSDIQDNTRMILVNAIYFKSIWTTPFNPALTRPRSFYVTKEETVETPMMVKKADFRVGWSKELQCRALELPYVDDNLSMIILLPNEIDGLATVENNLNSSNLHDLVDTLTFDDVLVSLPKFKLEKQVSLKPVLEQMGLTDIFDPTLADLSRISTDPDLFVSAVEHKAVIEVNEKGTEAAAATAIMVANCMAMIEPSEFIVDRPFMFLLLHKQLNVVLFIGSFKRPEDVA